MKAGAGLAPTPIAVGAIRRSRPALSG